MDDTSSVDTSSLPKKFLDALKVGVQSRISNGKLTLRLAYNGPLDNVVKLIDFGDVSVAVADEIPVATASHLFESATIVAV